MFLCGDCDVRYLFPGLSETDEARLYAEEFEGFMAARAGADAGWDGPERHIAANRSQLLRRSAILEPLLPKGGRILEVGCSSGFMLYPLAARGLSCTGVEPSGVFADHVRAQGLPCFDSMDALEEAAPEPFDLIMHYYVLEHVRDPAAFLRRQLALLKPGGRLVFEVPNADDALSGIYDIPAYERFIWVISHRWYFSPRSLGRLLDGLGVRHDIRLDQRYDLSNHMVWARDGRPGGAGRFTPVLGEEIEALYKKALIQAGHGDTIVAMVQA